MGDHDGNRDAEMAVRKVCGVCGQDFDLTDLDQVFHHHADPHEPLAGAGQSGTVLSGRQP